MRHHDLFVCWLVLVSVASLDCVGRRGGGDDEEEAAGSGDGDADTDADTDGDSDADADADLDAERRIELVSGDGQFMLASWPAGEPLVVRVTDGGGHPVAGEDVTWEVTEGALAGPAGEPVTDADGLARKSIVGGGIDQFVSYTRQRVRASLTNGQSVEFRTTTTHTGGNGSLFEPSVLLLRPEGAQLRGRDGDVLADGVQVQVVLTTGPETGHGLSEVAARVEPDPAGDPRGPRASCVGGTVWTGADGIAHCDVELHGPPGSAGVRVVTGGARIHTLFLTID